MSTTQPVTAQEISESEERERGLEHAGVDAATLDKIVEQYLATQLWAQVDLGQPKLDCNLDENYSIEDISPEYRDAVQVELRDVIAAHPLAFRMWVGLFNGDVGQWAHDYYLTREGHGAGFWDRFYSDDWRSALGDYWTKIAESAGVADLLQDNGSGLLVP